MYFVLEAITETTMAMCHFEDVAYAIAESLPCQCIVRYCGDMNCIYPAHTNFFDKKNVKIA